MKIFDHTRTFEVWDSKKTETKINSRKINQSTRYCKKIHMRNNKIKDGNTKNSIP